MVHLNTQASPYANPMCTLLKLFSNAGTRAYPSSLFVQSQECRVQHGNVLPAFQSSARVHVFGHLSLEIGKRNGVLEKQATPDTRALVDPLITTSARAAK
jgi:hypothetical protein